MKKIINSIVVLASFLFVSNGFYAQKVEGNGNLIKKEISIFNINSLEISNNFNVLLFQGNTETIVIQTDENLLDYIEVKTIDNVLTASIKKKVEITKFRAMTLIVTVKDVKSVKLSGECNLSTRYELNLSDLLISISGNSTTDIKMKGSSLNIVNSGASRIELSGKVDNFNLKSSGTTTFFAKEFVAVNADLKLSGMSEVDLNVIGNLIAETSGSVVLNYRGNPTTKISTSGNSIVKSID